MSAKQKPKGSRKRHLTVVQLWAAVITFVAAVIAILATLPLPPRPGPEPPILAPVGSGTGRIEGALTDREGNPLTDMTVAVRGGPESRTDATGRFVLNRAPTGDQMIEVKPRSGKGAWRQNTYVQPRRTTRASIVYDAGSNRLGLLSIAAPVDGGDWEVRKDGKEHRAAVYGRCDGLAEILGTFEVWVLIGSERDSSFWVQQPPAVVDSTSATWRGRVLLGNPEHPPQPNEQWTIVAVAADADSALGRVLTTPSLSRLPPHVNSNVVTVETRIKQGG
jgi:hypothetical protein